MKTVILIYLLIGFILNFFGLLAKKITEAIKEVKRSSVWGTVIGKPKKPKWKIVVFEIILRGLAFLFYPILYVILLIDYLQGKQQHKKDT
jgi:hypothetical protein